MTDPHDQDRAQRLVRLIFRAGEVFGGPERGLDWLKEPQYALGWAAPLQFAETEAGAREVERLIGRIEHGIPP